MLSLLTHAGRQQIGPIMEFEGETGTLHRTVAEGCRIIRDGKVVAEQDNGPAGLFGRMFDNFLNCITGAERRMIIELENARMQTLVVNGAQQCTPVHTVDDRHIVRTPFGDVYPDEPADEAAKHGCSNTIAGLDEVWRLCYETFQLPSEAGEAPWTVAPGHIDLRDIVGSTEQLSQHLGNLARFSPRGLGQHQGGVTGHVTVASLTRLFRHLNGIER